MRRASTSDDGSLELLLDTVCNTFGVIIFIAILLALLASPSSSDESSENAEDVSAADLRLLESQRADLDAEIESLRESVAAQQSFGESNAAQEAAQAAAALEKERARRARLLARKSELVGDSTAEQIAIEDSEEQAAASEEEVQRAKKRRDALLAKISKAASAKGRTARFPTLTRTKGPFAYYFLRHERLYGPSVDGFGQLNRAEFTFPKADGKTRVLPKPNAGLVINTGNPNLRQIKDKLGYAKSRRYVVTLFVWPDSFAEYDAVRVAIEALSLRRRLEIVNDDVYLGSDDGGYSS